MTPDHLPASQSIFLSRLIEVKSAEAPTHQSHPYPLQQQQPFMPEMIDFEAFGQSLEGDQSKTQWPPAPFHFDLSSFAALTNTAGPGVGDTQQPVVSLQHNQQQQQQQQQITADGMPNHQPPANAGTAASGSSNTVSTLPTDLDGWVAATQFPMPGLSLGMGSNFGQDDLMFTQDSFWKSIFEGQPNNGQGMGMV